MKTLKFGGDPLNFTHGRHPTLFPILSNFLWNIRGWRPWVNFIWFPPIFGIIIYDENGLFVLVGVMNFENDPT